MTALTLRNARILGGPDGLMDLAVIDGRIAKIGAGLTPAAEDVDLGGRLLTAGFIETHIHLDKSCILDRVRMRGGLDEAIAEVARVKGAFTEDDVAARAARTLAKCVAKGATRMRTHVEIDPGIGLRGYRGVKRAAAAFAWAIDVEICVFPQEGLLNNPGTDALLIEALEDGAQTLGGAPYTDSDPHGQIDWVFETAKRYDVDIDMHLDFGADPSGLDAEHVCRRADEYGWGGRVAIGHVTKFAYLDPERFDATARRLADAGVAVTVLPSTDLFLMGRDHDCAVPRGVTPLHRMLGHGVTCSLSTNNVLNPFTPFGDCSLVRMANLYANIAQVGDRPGLADCLSMVTERSAKLMNLDDYGVREGAPADLVALDATDPALAVAELAQPLFGYKAGRRSFTHDAARLHPPA
ncbi:MAG: amidohydrolase family protein [Pseudomonadota bacterium]